MKAGSAKSFDHFRLWPLPLPLRLPGEVRSVVQTRQTASTLAPLGLTQTGRWHSGQWMTESGNARKLALTERGIFEQHRRAGSPSRQTSGATNAGVQVLSLGCGNHRRGRAHAHDPKGAVADDGRIASCTAVLFPGWVSLVSVPGPPRLHRKLRQSPQRSSPTRR